MAAKTATDSKAPAAGDHLEIKDSRTGKVYTVPITDETIRTADLRQIKVEADRLRHAWATTRRS